MNDRFYTVNGYGMCVEKVEPNKVLTFLEKHADTIPKQTNPEYVVDEYEIITSVFADVLSQTICKETELNFTYVEGYNGSYVIFPKKAPYDYTDKEKTLNQAELTNIVNKYADELGINDVGEFSVEGEYDW